MNTGRCHLNVSARVVSAVLVWLTCAVPAPSQEVPPKPPPPVPSIAVLVGRYVLSGDTITVLEQSGSLAVYQTAKGIRVAQSVTDRTFVVGADTVRFTGSAPDVGWDGSTYRRLDEGKWLFRVTPLRPIEELRREAEHAAPPSPGPGTLEPDLVELAPLEKSMRFDVRYATAENFLGTPVYTQARSFLQRSAAAALVRAHRWLATYGYGLLIHDAYRPWSVTKIFWDATPPAQRDFVANPARGSKHNRGCAVDVTLYDLRTGEPVDMPSTYDEFSDRAFASYPGGTSLQRWHRALLRNALRREGFANEPVEWWHFDYRAWERYPVLNIPFERIP